MCAQPNYKFNKHDSINYTELFTAGESGLSFICFQYLLNYYVTSKNKKSYIVYKKIRIAGRRLVRFSDENYEDWKKITMKELLGDIIEYLNDDVVEIITQTDKYINDINYKKEADEVIKNLKMKVKNNRILHLLCELLLDQEFVDKIKSVILINNF
jgi:hypothetical protein